MGHFVLRRIRQGGVTALTAIMSFKKEEEFLLFLIRHNGGQGGHLAVPDSSKYKLHQFVVTLGKGRTRSRFFLAFVCTVPWPLVTRSKKAKT